MTIEEIYYSEDISVRSLNVCNNNDLKDLSTIIKHYRENRTFDNLRNCGRKSNEELTALCLKYMDYDSNQFVEPLKQKKQLITTIINFTRTQREIVNSFIEINTNNLSNRSKNAITSFLNGNLKIRNISERILTNDKFNFQDIKNVPEGCTYNPEREKPWGTNHAVLMGKDVIKEPFAVINADDFYGQESFAVLADFLRSVEGKNNEYSMVGYHVGNTLSESGSVSRGVCVVDENGYLKTVVERTHIEEKGGKIIYIDENSEEVVIEPNTPVSMNMWGFTPDYFDYSIEYFKEFLAENGQKLKSEFYIPLAVNNLIVSEKAKCKVLDTTSKWFGVTYAEDRPQVVLKINNLVRKGVYPEKLF